MLVRGRRQDTLYTLSVKPESFSAAVNGGTVLVYDRAGRFYSLYRDSAPGSGHYRRSLSGQVLHKWSTIDGRQRRWLEHTEADRLIDAAAGQLRRLRTALSAPDWQWLTPPDNPTYLSDIERLLERGAQFDSAAARSDAARFAQVYRPIGMLPPDQYLALVLQATEGCSFNTCTFCDLYHQPFRVKTPDEFRRHIQQVREYLGESMLLRQRSIFLGAANALAIPMARLTPLLEIIQAECHFEELPGRGEKSLNPPNEILRPNPAQHNAPGVYAFLDAFTGTRKSMADYRVLAGLGLKRVYIGLESGHDSLLQFVKKPGCAADAVETVHAIKAAGVNVGVIVMIGLGGDRFAAGHVADTIDVLNGMELGRGDLLYFSELVEEPGTAYPRLAAQQAIRALNREERAAQRAAIRAGLKSGEVTVSNYDVREFVY
jgi:hypothetical protein